MTKVRYLGEYNGKWRGPVTCHEYDFTREAPLRYVDNRDLTHLLAAKGGEGEALFVVEVQ